MEVLIKSAHLLDPGGPHHDTITDLRLRDNRVVELGNDLSAGADTEVLTGNQLYASPGWFDVGCHTGDPGFEHREDSRSLARAARTGGYTQLAILPNTEPCIDGKSAVTYLRNEGLRYGVAFHALGALSEKCAGKEITEMIDMHQAGAIGFTDGDQPVQHAGLLLRALLYAKTFDGIILNQPLDTSIAGSGHLHEGVVSTRLGMTAIPSLAEVLMVERDLRLLAYSESRLHIHNISTAAAVDRIRQAKAAGLPVSASVPALNLAYTAEVLAEFDALYKVMPPLREETDRQALIEGVIDGTIDLITSNHTPLEPEHKQLEFPYADFGAVGLSTTFALCHRVLGDRLSLADLVSIFAHRPRQLFGQAKTSAAAFTHTLHIGVDAPADLTVFELTDPYRLTPAMLGSKSKNSPLLGQEFSCRIRQTFLAI